MNIGGIMYKFDVFLINFGYVCGSYKTLKQNLIDRMSKAEFLKSKVYTIAAFVLISTLLVFIISMILGGIYSDYNEFRIIFSDLEYLLAYAINLFGFFIIGCTNGRNN